MKKRNRLYPDLPYKADSIVPLVLDMATTLLSGLLADPDAQGYVVESERALNYAEALIKEYNKRVEQGRYDDSQ